MSQENGNLANSEVVRGQLAAILLLSEEAIITIDLDGVITGWNAGAEKIFGYSAREAIGETAAKLIPAQDPKGDPDILGRIRRGDRVESFQAVRRAKDGKPVHVSLSVAPISDSSGKIIGAVGIARKLIERHDSIETRLLAAIVSSSDDAIVSKTTEGIITSWNKGAEQIFGYTAEEAVGRPISIIIPPERADEEPQILSRIRRGEVIDHFETQRLRKDGRRIDVSVTISPVRDAHGKIVGASKIARDISVTKNAERVAREERQRLEITLASIGDGVIVTDADGRVKFLNPVAEALTGWPLAEAQRQPLELIFNIINEQTRRRIENPVARVLREGMIVGLANHTLLIARDGSERAIDDSAAPIRSDGDVSGVVLVFRDVTGARAAEDFHARLAAIVESSDDAIVGKDLRGMITSWNAGAERIFGYSQQEAVGRSITMIIPPDRLHEESEILARLRKGERVEHFETVRIAKDRRKVHVSLTISLIRDGEGNIIGVSKIARDVTEKKKVERELAEKTERLRQAQAELRQHAEELERKVLERTAELRVTVSDLEAFSYSISHDLRAPLRAMQGFAQLLHENYGQKLDAEGRNWLERIMRSGARLNQLIDDVLSYSRIGRGELRLQPVYLDDLVPRVIEEYPNIGEANPELTLQKPLAPVIASEPLLIQCLANLLGNAVKFVPPGTRPHIQVRTEPVNGSVRLWIEDNGVGIPRGEQDRIFGLFTRGSAPSAVEGTGVGLAVVQRAVLRMRGSVGVDSEPGKGSRFWIQLPAAKS